MPGNNERIRNRTGRNETARSTGNGQDASRNDGQVEGIRDPGRKSQGARSPRRELGLYGEMVEQSRLRASGVKRDKRSKMDHGRPVPATKGSRHIQRKRIPRDGNYGLR